MTLTVTEKATTSTGCPWAGGGGATVDAADVVALGKHTAWGSSVIKFMLRLKDGREVFVKACDQAPDAERWLRKVAKPLHVAAPSREEGWVTVWTHAQEEGR